MQSPHLQSGLTPSFASAWDDLAQVHPDHIREHRDVLGRNEPKPEDGCIVPPDLPGFGVTLNEKLL